MVKNSLKRIKSGATHCASSVLFRLDLITEESRQEKRFKILGEKVLQAVLDDKLDTLKDDPSIVELVGAIQEKKKIIQELRQKASFKGPYEKN